MFITGNPTTHAEIGRDPEAAAVAAERWGQVVGATSMVVNSVQANFDVSEISSPAPITSVTTAETVMATPPAANTAATTTETARTVSQNPLYAMAEEARAAIANLNGSGV